MCSLSCSGLDKEVTGGSDCHCTFNLVHLVWIIGAPLLLCCLLGFLYKRRKQPAQPEEPLLVPKPDEEGQAYQPVQQQEVASPAEPQPAQDQPVQEQATLERTRSTGLFGDEI